MRRSDRIFAAAAVSALALAFGCGSNDGVGPQLTESEGIAFGWQAFEGGNFARAESFFLAAVRANGRSVEANTGLGWARAYSGDLDLAAASFEKAAMLDLAGADARAGLAAVRLAGRELQKAIDRATEALALAPEWTFDHRAGVDAQDLHLILAQAYALQGEARYAAAQMELDRLDPQNGLDPDDSRSWGVGQVLYSSYRDALLEAIEAVERRVGAAIP